MQPLKWKSWVGLVLVFLIPSAARAHFLWLVVEQETKGRSPAVIAFLSETPSPDLPEFLKRIEASKITAGDRTLSWTKGENAYQVQLPEPRPNVVDGFCDLGLMKKADVAFRLLYTARTQFEASKAGEGELKDHLRMKLVANGDKPHIVEVSFHGKPLPGAEIKLFPQDGDAVTVKSDSDGHVPFNAVPACEGLLAKWVEKTPGEHEGKRYDEIRYYATLSFPTMKKTVAKAESIAPFALLPEPINSFGGAVAGDWLYTYSGHVGETHKYHEATTTKAFRRLNLKDRTTWEELPPGPPLQGVTLMAHGGMLYRIGGMKAVNKPGEADNLVSVADFARFDPATKTWTDMPAMPSPRSTHDSVVVGDKIYVIGGWSMNGGTSSNAEFCEDALIFDLAAKDAKWQTLPKPPFQRRALAVGELGGKIYVLGGLTEEGKVVKTVDVYDIAKKTWSSGPELAGKGMIGFAASAFSVGKQFFVNGADGPVYRLNAAGNGWENVGQLAVPRITHRLLPGLAGEFLAVGGNFAGTPTRIIESFRPAHDTKVVAWSVPSSGDAIHGQGVGLVRSKLIAAGGNRSAEPHAFAAENLLKDTTRFSLGAMESETIAALPEARQSGALLVVPEGRQNLTYLLGGIGPDGAVTRTLGNIFQLDADGKAWKKLSATIPDARGMFQAVSYKDAAWIFGGSVYDPRPGSAVSSLKTEVLRWDRSKDGSTFEASGEKLPRARRSFAGALLGSKYYLIGGVGEGAKPVETIDVFDLENRSWSTVPGPSQTRLFSQAAALDGKIYLVGGFASSKEAHFAPVSSVEVFDPATNTWTTLLEQLPVPEGYVHIFPLQGRLLLFSTDMDQAGLAHFAIVAP